MTARTLVAFHAHPDDEALLSAGTLARAADATIAVLRRHDGTLVAFVASCTHLGCTVRFRADKDDLHCGCHGATFDPATGAPRSGPAVSPLGSIPVEVRDGRIFVGT